MPPPFSPTSRAPRVHARRADHPTAAPPYTRRAAPGLPLAVAPRTALAPYRDPCRRPGYPFPKAPPPIKTASVPHARAPEPLLCSARCRGRLNASSFPSCTARACTPALWPDQTVYTPEHEFQRLPLSSHRRAPRSACSPGQPTILGPPLGHREATRATHCSTPPLSSPELKHPRLRHHRSTAAARK
jgi:hypothetical protein